MIPDLHKVHTLLVLINLEHKELDPKVALDRHASLQISKILKINPLRYLSSSASTDHLHGLDDV